MKFQVFFAEELATPDYVHWDLFRNLELPQHVWERAVSDAHASGLRFYSDVFGTRSLEMLEACGADGYKIHATDVDNTSLLEHVSIKRKPVLLSTGGRLPEEIDHALKVLEGCDITLMYGFQAEPTPLGENHLSRIPLLRERFGLPVGFQDHTEGASVFAWYVPYLALGLGASVIEKHLTLSHVAELEDHVSALTGDEFACWVAEMKKCTDALGDANWALTSSEQDYRDKVIRAVCSVRQIPVGSRISTDDLTLLRTSDPQAIVETSQVVGRLARIAISPHTAVREEHLQ
ncbi:MAG: N-acetylneuraminate synthase family protein [Deltaproteobacteria bacterium]|nr:N-acetylneuraminate synthase family protein [Deltaproteobacteria bacterium]